MHWQPYSDRLENTLRSSQVFYHRLNETSGVTASNLSPNAGLDADYISATLDGGDSPDGLSCPSFDGINDGVDGDGNEAALQAAWTNRNEFSVMCWAKVRALSVWTDGVLRIITEMWADADNNYKIQKRGNNEIRFEAILNAQVYRYNHSPFNSTDWFSVGFRLFDVGGGNKTLTAYVNGEIVGSDTEATQNWITAPDRYTLFAQRNLASQFWDGTGSHSVLYNGDIGDQAMKDLMRI
jgi:hypothetical protein